MDANLWDFTTKRQRVTLKGHSSSVLSVAFSPDGKRVATGSSDQIVRLWDVATGQELIKLPGHSSGVAYVVFSSDGKTLGSMSIGGSV